MPGGAIADADVLPGSRPGTNCGSKQYEETEADSRSIKRGTVMRGENGIRKLRLGTQEERRVHRRREKGNCGTRKKGPSYHALIGFHFPREKGS